MNSQFFNIAEEKLISKEWNFRKRQSSDYPEGILVTGANSYIGVHIISELLKKKEGQIHLLLRAKDSDEAILKMKSAFDRWELDNFDEGSVIFHIGNVCDELMGLNPDEYNLIINEVGQVIHLAMNPLYHLPYHFFQKTWLPELDKMIDFCGNSQTPKSLHYASSYNANFFQTDDDFQNLNSNAWQSGYAGFKWVANKTIENALAQNLRGCIYDIPLVIGSLEKGLCPDHYSMWHIMNIFLKSGYYFPFCFRIIPVDILAEVMVFNILQEKTNNSKQIIRPVLLEPVSEELLENTIESFGIIKSTKEIARESYHNKLRFDFMIPKNFNELLQKANQLQPCFPVKYNCDNLPSTIEVFEINLKKFIQQKFLL